MVPTSAFVPEECSNISLPIWHILSKLVNGSPSNVTQVLFKLLPLHFDSERVRLYTLFKSRVLVSYCLSVLPDIRPISF